MTTYFFIAPNGSGSLVKNSHWQDCLAYFNPWRA
jgi:hypothetical protein